MTAYFNESPESMAYNLCYDAGIIPGPGDIEHLAEEIAIISSEAENLEDPACDAFGASRILLQRIKGRQNLRKFLDDLNAALGKEH
jgi:hypothetical protein